MEVRILHLFPEAMNLYGEYANVAVLERTMTGLGHSVRVDSLSLYEERDVSGYDLYYMGAGTERRQKLALAQLRPYAPVLGAAMEVGKLLLFTGNAFELLGAAVTDAAGRRHEGLGFFGFETVEGEGRIVGDCLASCAESDVPVVGFMNKCSRTTGVETPWFTMQMGFGNEVEGGAEGLCSPNCLATHLSGPLLVKNPAILSRVIQRLTGAAPAAMDETMEKAYRTTAQALQKRLDNMKR